MLAGTQPLRRRAAAASAGNDTDAALLQAVQDGVAKQLNVEAQARSGIGDAAAVLKEQARRPRRKRAGVEDS